MRRLPVIVQHYAPVVSQDEPQPLLPYDQEMHNRHQQNHKRRLREMRSTVDNKPPRSFGGKAYFQSQGKKHQLEEGKQTARDDHFVDRYTAIERENVLLLNKIKDIIRKPSKLIGGATSQSSSRERSEFISVSKETLTPSH